MNKMIAFGLVIMACIATVGCGSVQPYRAIDLDKDLSPQTLQRYEDAFQEIHASGHPHGAMVAIEHSNWWPLGLIAYYRRGTVMRTHTPDGPVYHVMSGWGIGPLSILYSSANHATFDAGGKRLSGMRMDNVLLGHLAMFHSGDSHLANGQVEKSESWHLIHHVFNVHRMNGHTYVSLFTVPNAIGGMIGHGH